MPLEQPLDLSGRGGVHPPVRGQPPPVSRFIGDPELAADALGDPADPGQANRVHLLSGKFQAGMQPDHPLVALLAARELPDAGSVAAFARVGLQAFQQPPPGICQPTRHHGFHAVSQPPGRAGREPGETLWCHCQLCGSGGRAACGAIVRPRCARRWRAPRPRASRAVPDAGDEPMPV